MSSVDFEWDKAKDILNQAKHGVSFEEASQAFTDPKRIIYKDLDHSTSEEYRFFCLGKINDRVCAVRFTLGGIRTRIFGAGYWRKERKFYEEKNKRK